jgi:hypothetical protein
MTAIDEKRVAGRGADLKAGRASRLARGALLAALVVSSAVLPAATARAADEAAALEQRVKAAFLYQFASYIEWPPGTFAQRDTPVTIAVVGADPVAAELSQVVTGRTAGGRTVAVRRVKAGESLDGVQILFIGREESTRLAQLSQSAQPRSILTVTETEGALKQGSVINFVIADRRVRFEVALDTAEKSGLRLSSRLLAVAQDVRMGVR